MRFFSYNGPSYVFCVIVSYYSYLSRSIGSTCSNTERVQWGYRWGTLGYRRGYSGGTGGVRTVGVQWGTGGVQWWWW